MFVRFASVVCLFPAIASACTLCDPSSLKLQTLRQDGRTAKFIAVGTLNNARLIGERGATDLQVESLVKDHPVRNKQTTLVLPRWTPIDPKSPPRMMVFFDEYDGKLDPFRGIKVRTDQLPKYLAGGLAIDDRDQVRQLSYYFDHLDSADPDVGADAYLELAKAPDTAIAQLGPKLDPARLRRMLVDPKTPIDRLGLFAYLLGACGQKADIKFLADLIDAGNERSSAALSGAIGGLITLDAAVGWKRCQAILGDQKRSFNDKLAILGSLRFLQAATNGAHEKAILECQAILVTNGDLADMAIEDLRRSKLWGLTDLVLAQHGKSTHSAPLVRNAIIRYALTCPKPTAVEFVTNIRKKMPEVVRNIEEALSFELPPAPPKS